MKYIIDAQISYKIAIYLNQIGYDIIHTNDFPNKEFTTDKEIRELSKSQNRIVISKDSDFLDSYLIKKIPEKILLITTGNTKNIELKELFKIYFEKIDLLFEQHFYIEFNQNELIIHE